MAHEFAIANVALSKRQRSLPDLVDGHRDISFEVKIDVENGGDTPLYVVDELRSIAYDAATRVLSLRLSEPPPQPVREDAPTFHIPAPRTLTLEPHAAATITVKIPAILKELRPGPELVPIVEQTDIRSMRTIRCEVASSKHPIEHLGAETAHQLRTRLTSWGQVVSKDTAVEPDMRESETDRPRDGRGSDRSKKR